MDVVLIRHARPEVAPGICYGALDLALALPVSPPAERIVATLDGLRPDRILTSPAARARDTATALSHGIDTRIDLEIEPRLRELDFGQWEGREWATIDRADLDHWAANLMAARPHGGESAAQVMARVVDWAGSLPADAGGCLWVVTHAGPIRMLAAHWLGLPLARTLAWELGFGATCRFHLEGADGMGARLSWWNRLSN
ncbi:histidine phosphatase family protein [Cupriavidus sp. SIMBA_020]|uniref:histidine phosphatase family protein n=1 Tax=Cupriavidus sp. SIMBA_020 TaxID=3085766 RepID=UPI00397E7BFA